MFGDVVLNEQLLLARLRTAGGTERIAVIGESTKGFVLCKSIGFDSTLTFRLHIWSRLYPVTLESSADRWKPDFGLHNKIAPGDSGLRFIVFL